MEKSVFAARLDHCYQELKWLYCELYQNDREAFADGVHPNAQGNAAIAQAVYDALAAE